MFQYKSVVKSVTRVPCFFFVSRTIARWLLFSRRVLFSLTPEYVRRLRHDTLSGSTEDCAPLNTF